MLKSTVVSLLIGVALSSSGVYADEYAGNESEIVEGYDFSGLMMSVPEGYALSKLYNCDSLNIYTVDNASDSSAFAEQLSVFRAVCNDGDMEVNLSFDVMSMAGIHYVSSEIGNTYSFSEEVDSTHFSLHFLKKNDFVEDDAVAEAAFLLAQVAENLAEISQGDDRNEVVRASVSRDRSVGIEFNGTYYGRVREAGGTITPRDLGTGSTCTDSSRRFTRSFGSGDCGHIIARRLGGSGRVGSPSSTQIFPQDPSTNRGPYNRWEGRVAEYVEGNCTARANVRFYYSGNSLRPRSLSYRVYRRTNTSSCIRRFEDAFDRTNVTYVTMSFQN